MNSLPVSTVLAGSTVSDLHVALWNRIRLGRGPVVRPTPALAGRAVPRNYILQVMHDAERAGGSMATVQVAAVDGGWSERIVIVPGAGPNGAAVTLVESARGLDASGSEA